MHHDPEITFAEKTCIKSTQQKIHPTVDTLSLMKLDRLLSASESLLTIYK